MIDLEEHISYLTGYANSLVKNHHDAEDLVQETLIMAMAKAHMFDGRHPKAWLSRVLFNLMINKYRRRKRVQFVEMTHDMVDEFTAINNEPGSKEVSPVLEEAINSLNEVYRDVLLLRADDIGYKEIADIMGCPLGTVMSRISRAKKAVQKSIQKASSNDFKAAA